MITSYWLLEVREIWTLLWRGLLRKKTLALVSDCFVIKEDPLCLLQTSQPQSFFPTSVAWSLQQLCVFPSIEPCCSSVPSSLSVLSLLTPGAISMRNILLDLCMQHMHKILGDFSCTALTYTFLNEIFPNWLSCDNFHKKKKRNTPNSKAVPLERTMFFFQALVPLEIPKETNLSDHVQYGQK